MTDVVDMGTLNARFKRLHDEAVRALGLREKRKDMDSDLITRKTMNLYDGYRRALDKYHKHLVIVVDKDGKAIGSAKKFRIVGPAGTRVTVDFIGFATHVPEVIYAGPVNTFYMACMEK